jgi:hypothetical protein
VRGLLTPPVSRAGRGRGSGYGDRTGRKHQGNQFTGGGNDTDVAAAPGADTVADLTVAGMRGDPLHGLDRGPAQQSGTLLICGYLDIKSAGDPRLTSFLIFFDGRWMRLSSVSVSRLG